MKLRQVFNKGLHNCKTKGAYNHVSDTLCKNCFVHLFILLKDYQRPQKLIRTEV